MVAGVGGGGGDTGLTRALWQGLRMISLLVRKQASGWVGRVASSERGVAWSTRDRGGWEGVRRSEDIRSLQLGGGAKRHSVGQGSNSEQELFVMISQSAQPGGG